jgi:hypothetical protein
MGQSFRGEWPRLSEWLPPFIAIYIRGGRAEKCHRRKGVAVMQHCRQERRTRLQKAYK